MSCRLRYFVHKTYIFKFKVSQQNDCGFRYAVFSLAFSSYNPSKIQTNVETSPILILHGLLGSRNNWNSLSKSIAEKTKRQV